jgi:SsrA-binding protein
VYYLFSEENEGEAMERKGSKIIARNKKAVYDYHIEETFEVGIVLTGTEIKSIRQGKVNLQDSYARIDKGELFIVGMHISPFEPGNRFNVDPTRTRKLLMHQQEIDKLLGQTKLKGLTIIPLDLHLRHGFAKIQLGLARGKKLYDKRATAAKRDAERIIERKLKEQNTR